VRVTKVGDNLLNKTAQGRYCLVTVKVTNIGKRLRPSMAGNQKAYGADGAQFSADSTAGLYANARTTPSSTRSTRNTVIGTVMRCSGDRHHRADAVMITA
jgi:hypothetical protein